jgi:hypothetical protein
VTAHSTQHNQHILPSRHAFDIQRPMIKFTPSAARGQTMYAAFSPLRKLPPMQIQVWN